MIKPLGNRVLVKQEEAVEQTQSGIYIPTSAKEKPTVGEVIAIGSSDDLEVKVGDKVMYQKFGGTKVEVDNQEYLLLEQSDILAII